MISPLAFGAWRCGALIINWSRTALALLAGAREPAVLGIRVAGGRAADDRAGAWSAQL
ncbi:MAG: hypothetical protein U0703_19695 [Anaerolineae bacterium]